MKYTKSITKLDNNTAKNLGYIAEHLLEMYENGEFNYSLQPEKAFIDILKIRLNDVLKMQKQEGETK